MKEEGMLRIIRSDRGFTMIEILAVLGIIAVLAAVMTPSILKHIKDSKISRATKDCEMIATAMASFYKDTGRWPTDLDNNHRPSDQEVRLLWTNTGETPGQTNNTIGWTNLNPRDTFENQLVLNTPRGRARNAYPTTGQNKWDGPYQNEFKADPWGRRYLCNVYEFHPNRTGAVWVISAGPDGIIQSAASATTLTGDDIAFLLRR